MFLLQILFFNLVQILTCAGLCKYSCTLCLVYVSCFEAGYSDHSFPCQKGWHCCRASASNVLSWNLLTQFYTHTPKADTLPRSAAQGKNNGWGWATQRGRQSPTLRSSKVKLEMKDKVVQKEKKCWGTMVQIQPDLSTDHVKGIWQFKWERQGRASYFVGKFNFYKIVTKKATDFLYSFCVVIQSGCTTKLNK